MDRKTVSMWRVTRNQTIVDIWAVLSRWFMPNVGALVLLLCVVCSIVHMLWLGRCFLNDCKAHLPGADYQRIASAFGFVWFWNPGRRKQWQYTAEESGENGAALLRIWRGNMLFIIVSLAVMAALVRV